VRRQFSIEAPNRVWAGDITYFPTREGWFYLAVLLDLFSRRVVGWAMSSRIDHELVCQALDMAIGRRSPAPGLICHSDRGSQYASEAYQRCLMAVGARCSMSRTGDCWDNAVVESFNSSLKVEMNLPPTLSRAEVKTQVIDYLETFYNPRRRHSTLGYLSPAEFEAAAAMR
jgi:transposase InsO family protein